MIIFRLKKQNKNTRSVIFITSVFLKTRQIWIEVTTIYNNNINI